METSVAMGNTCVSVYYTMPLLTRHNSFSECSPKAGISHVMSKHFINMISLFIIQNKEMLI